MPARELPNLGLQAFFEFGEDGWDDEYDLNFLKLSVLVQGGVIGRVAEYPAAPAAGDTYINKTSHKVAVFDDGVWKEFTPRAGWLLYDRSEAVYVTFEDGAWDVLETGSDAPVIPDPAGHDGEFLAVAGGAYALVPAPAGGGGSGGNVEGSDTGPVGHFVEGPPAYRYWQILALAPVGGEPYTALSNLEFRTEVGVPKQATGGLPIASGSIGGASAPASAFDGDNGTSFISNGAMPNWIGYRFAEPITVLEVAMRNRADGYYYQVPKTFTVRGSHDGEAWSDVWEVADSGFTGNALEQRVFTSPLAGTPPVVREVYPTKIAALNDVSDTPPENGQALVWDADAEQYVPGTVAAGGGTGGTGGGSVLAEKVLTADADSIVFDGIEADQYDLKLSIFGRSTFNDNDDAVFIRFNDDAGANYIWAQHFGNSAHVVNAAADNFRGPQIAAGLAPEGTFDFLEVNIGGYDTDKFKSIYGHGVNYSVDDPKLRSLRYTGRWKQTAAVEKITLTPSPGAKFKAGTVVRLYGSKPAAGGGTGEGGGGQASEATFTKPKLADFPVKQGLDTAPSVAVDTPLGINIYTTGPVAAEKWHLLLQEPPSGFPFEIVTRVNDLNPAVNYHSLGLVLRDAAGKMITLEQINVDGTSKLEMNRWAATDPSTHVNNDISYSFARGEKFPWLRMTVHENGITAHVSKDGLAWNMLLSIDGSNRAWLGPITEIGLAVKASPSPSQYTAKVNAHFLSYDTKVPTTVPASGGGALGKVAAEATLAPVLTNGYADLGNDYQPVRAFKTGRLVTLTGVMKGPDGVAAFTLPAGWRPAQNLHGVDNHGDVLGRWDLFADGRYLPAGGNPATFACVNVTYEVAEADGAYQMVGGGSDGGSGSAGRSIVNLDKPMPALSEFTQLGVGGTRTVTESAGKAFALRENAPVGGAKVFGVFKDPPPAPYRVAVFVQSGAALTFNGPAIGWTNGEGLQLATFVQPFVETSGWGNPGGRNWNTGMSARHNLLGAGTGGWVGLRDDGTARFVELSQDGVNWSVIQKIPYADAPTMTKPFIGMYSENNGSPGGADYPQGVSYLLYDEDALDRDYG